MTSTNPTRPRVFFDADVLFAGSASSSEHGASLVLLHLAELTLIEGYTSQQVITEVERNLKTYLPEVIPLFHQLVSRALRVIPDPDAATQQPFNGQAHPKDLPILVAAVTSQSHFLVTFNGRDFQPGHPTVEVVRPGDLLLRIRTLLAML